MRPLGIHHRHAELQSTLQMHNQSAFGLTRLTLRVRITQNCKTAAAAKAFLAGRGILHYYDLAEAHQHE